MISFEGLTESEFKANLGYKLMAGALVKLGKARFNVEYQMARISNPALDPHFWRHHILAGFGF